MRRNNQATYFYWIKARVFLKRSSFINEDAAVCFAILFWLHLSSSCRTTWFSLAVRRSFFSKELAIAKPAKYIWTTSDINLAILLSMQNFPLRTWQEHWLVNNLTQLKTRTIEVLIFPFNFTSQSRWFFFCTLYLKPTNLQVRY